MIYQYRKYKEVYEIDFDLLKVIISMCDDFVKGLMKLYDKERKETTKSIKRIKNTDNKLFLVLFRDE